MRTFSGVQKFSRADDGCELVVEIDRGPSGKFCRADCDAVEVGPVECVCGIQSKIDGEPRFPPTRAGVSPQWLVVMPQITMVAMAFSRSQESRSGMP